MLGQSFWLRSTEAPPPPRSPERTAWVTDDTPRFIVCWRFMDCAQAGGALAAAPVGAVAAAVGAAAPELPLILPPDAVNPARAPELKLDFMEAPALPAAFFKGDISAFTELPAPTSETPRVGKREVRTV